MAVYERLLVGEGVRLLLASSEGWLSVFSGRWLPLRDRDGCSVPMREIVDCRLLSAERESCSEQESEYKSAVGQLEQGMISAGH